MIHKVSDHLFKYSRLANFALTLLLTGAIGVTRVSYADDEFEKGFGSAGGLTAEDKSFTESDRTKLGGRLWTELQHYQFNSTALPSYLSFPNTLWLYIDSTLKNDLRVYGKIRSTVDPTISAGAVSPLTGTALSSSQTDLEELKLIFNVKKSVFFTVGKQKIKWGSGKLWNPTDFLNTERRNLLYADDRRLGVSLLKAHVPLGAANFYLIERFDSATQVDKLQHALRAEIPMGPTELCLSASAASNMKPIYGADFSAAVWDFDLYGEVSYTGGSSQVFFSATGAATNPNRALLNWATGVSYDLKYSDTDTLTLGLEYFSNDAGYSSTSDYLYVFAGGGYVPFNLGTRYGAFTAYLPKPGSWEKLSFTLSNIMNLSDQSVVTKFNTAITALDDLTIDLGFSAHYGNSSGEFRYGNQLWDASLRFLVDF